MGNLNKSIITNFFKDTNGRNFEAISKYFDKDFLKFRKIKSFENVTQKNPWWDFLRLLGYDDTILTELSEIGITPGSLTGFVHLWKWTMKHFRNYKIIDMIGEDDRVWVKWCVEIEAFSLIGNHFVGLDFYSEIVILDGKISEFDSTARLLNTLVQTCHLINQQNNLEEIQTYLIKLDSLGLIPKQRE